MVSQAVNPHVFPLRVVTQRLASTPNNRLPHIAPFLANTIANCRNTFSAAEGQAASKDGSDACIVIHKLKTQLSALLQDKSVAARWAAVVLIKATVEAGGWNILQGCSSWTRGMLAILNKPDPPTTKILCLLTLTRIFLLTQEHQSLVREITTPSIPPFVTACLNIITLPDSAKDARKLDATCPVLDTVLQVLGKLLPNHPSSFRPFVVQIRSLLAPILSPTPSDVSLPLGNESQLNSPSSVSVVLAQDLYAQLPQCAPKNTSNEEYSKYVRAVINQIHRTADHIFRAIVEDRVSSARLGTSSAHPKDYGEAVSDRINDDLNLPGWTGIDAGCERLTWLLTFLESFIATRSSSEYTLPVGLIVLMLERLFSVTAPDQQKPKVEARINPEIGRDEREGLWLELPHIHTSAIAVLATLLIRMGDTSMGIVQSALEQVLWVFGHEHESPEVRSSVYKLVSQMIKITGPSLTQSTVTSLSPLLRSACGDLLPAEKQTQSSSESATNGGKKLPLKFSNADSYLKTPSGVDRMSAASWEVCEPAAALLQTTLSKVPSSYLSVPMRSLIDRTIILVNDDKAMLASVLNPESRTTGKQVSSILPLYARSCSSSLEFEAVLRPRMPVLQQKQTNYEELDMEEEEGVSADESRAFGGSVEAEGEIIPATDTVRERMISSNPYDFLAKARDKQILSTEQDKRTHMQEQPFHPAPMETSKRNRESAEAENTEEPSFTKSASPPNKRARLSDDEIVDEEPIHPAASTPFVPGYAAGVNITESGPSEPNLMPDRTTSSSRFAVDADDSDDSLEMPKIYLDSDSEEDEDDEDEEEELEEIETGNVGE